MKVIVSTPAVPEAIVHDGAGDFHVADGHLIVTTVPSNLRIAIYAPGWWNSAVVVANKD